jgi:hypothetical protein
MFIARLFALLRCVTMVSDVAAQAQPMEGAWGSESETCVVQERESARTSSTSTFVFLGREWALEFVQFADDRCTQPTLKALFPGQYQITKPSSVVPIAHEATCRSGSARHRSNTPHARWPSLGSARAHGLPRFAKSSVSMGVCVLQMRPLDAGRARDT